MSRTQDRADIQVIKPEQWLQHNKDLLQESRQEYIAGSPKHIIVQRDRDT